VSSKPAIPPPTGKRSPLGCLHVAGFADLVVLFAVGAHLARVMAANASATAAGDAARVCIEIALANP
jgi:hypothetical protein